MTLDQQRIQFGVQTGGASTSSQQLRINNTGGDTLNWTTTTDQDWLSVYPASGTNAGMITVSVTEPAEGSSVTGTVTILDPHAAYSPQHVDVRVQVRPTTYPPIGEIAPTICCWPSVQGTVPVTGWALDDVEVESVGIYNDTKYLGDAVFVEGARPDIQRTYPDYPLSNRAGWTYDLVTNLLPNGGNGPYDISARATDAEGKMFVLGTLWIYCDNAEAVKPFGALDTPTQGGEASGSAYRSQGWVLTPTPNKIPEDGSTINVFIDGINAGHANYNVYRADIATLFPGYANSSGAMAYFDFDTTAYENGVHTISWSVADNAGNSEGIGSRYFTIQNPPSN